MKFGEDIEFKQKLSKSQISNDGKISSDGQLANTGYGQAEVLVNPLFIASIYSSFVNEGEMIGLCLDYNEKANIRKTKVFEAETTNKITEYLIQVVEDEKGTGHAAQIDGITIAGKTGTAEIKKDQNDESGNEIGWFNAFVVDENSENQLLIVSMVEDVKNKGGSHYVVPKLKTIFEQYIIKD